ncbi:copper-binding protein [Indioceanicola profundi]|uniref:copper-binding protein n=1 Tax=Indioceanicola profundi TaxID=2220096 RepID=UPI001CEC932D
MGHDDKAGAEGHGHHDVVVGTGTVKGLDAAKGTVKLAHDPIPALKWPAMVMDFKVAKDVDLGSLSAGQQVEFALGQDRPSPPSSRRADGPLPPRFLSIRDQVPRAKPGT